MKWCGDLSFVDFGITPLGDIIRPSRSARTTGDPTERMLIGSNRFDMFDFFCRLTAVGRSRIGCV